MKYQLIPISWGLGEQTISVPQGAIILDLIHHRIPHHPSEMTFQYKDIHWNEQTGTLTLKHYPSLTIENSYYYYLIAFNEENQTNRYSKKIIIHNANVITDNDMEINEIKMSFFPFDTAKKYRYIGNLFNREHGTNYIFYEMMEYP